MKFSWITFLIMVVCEVKTRPSTEYDVLNKTLTLPKGKSLISQTMLQHKTLSPHSAHIELTIKKRLMPKILIKDTSVEKNNNSTFKPTTRRPLMKSIKFTSKPHAIYYIHTRTHGEQSNFSRRRNFNGKKRFKPQNNTKYTPNTSENSSSVEDRFKNFTEVDDIDEPVEQKRKVFPNKQFNRMRGVIVTAASEQFKSVALYPLQNMDKYRSKSAFHEYLQKIKTIRPGMKGKSITTKTSPTKVNENMKNSQIKDNIQEDKTVTTSEKIVHLTTDKGLYLPITTEKSILSPSTTRNIQETLNKSETSIESANKIEISSKSDPGMIKTLPVIIVKGKSTLSDMHKTAEPITNSKFVTTEKTITTTKKLDSAETISEKIENSEAKTENSNILAPMTEKSVDLVIQIQKSNKLVTNTDIADHSTNPMTLDQTRKPVDLTITTKKSKELTTKKQKPVESAITTETSVTPLIKTKHLAAKIISEKSDLDTLKSVPHIIVTGKSITLSDINNTTVEALTDSNIVTSNEILDPKTRGVEENITTVTNIKSRRNNYYKGRREPFSN